MSKLGTLLDDLVKTSHRQDLFTMSVEMSWFPVALKWVVTVRRSDGAVFASEPLGLLPDAIKDAKRKAKRR